MKRSALIFTLAALALMPVPAARAAGDDEVMSPFEESAGRPRERLQKIFADTPLSADQKKQIRAVFKAHRTEVHDVRDKLAAAQRALVEASKSGGPDTEAARRAADRVGEASRDRALLRARLESEIRPILTPEQQKRLDAAKAKRRSFTSARQPLDFAVRA